MRLLLVLAGWLGAFSAEVLARPPDAPFNDGSERATDRGWIHAEIPVWDFADEGLPFRLIFTRPSERDLLARLLFASEARWAFSAGYVRIYNSFDAETGAFKNHGGHAAVFGVARQFRWHPPKPLRPAIPNVVIDFGAQYATRRFPADGTRANFQVVTGFEWTWRMRESGPEWTAAIVWPHFSNANLFHRNAGYDALALRLGRSVRF